MQLNKGHFYEFGPFRLNPEERLLVREDKPVSLSPKGFELLVFLVANHGRLVTKDQIFDAVWAGSFVEDSNLTVSISSLRRTLGEKESGNCYIETVTKAGYRFVASVQDLEDDSLAISLPAAAVAPSAEAATQPAGLAGASEGQAASVATLNEPGRLVGEERRRSLEPASQKPIARPSRRLAIRVAAIALLMI